MSAPQLIVLSAAWFLIGNVNLAWGQLPSLIGNPETPPPATTTDATSTLDQWRTDIKQRLAEAEAQAKQAAEADGGASQALKRRIAALTRVDLALAQLVGEEANAKKIADDSQKVQKALDQLVQRGLSTDEPKTFGQLDEVREDLRSERRRLERIVDKVKAAQAALEKSQEEFKQRDSARRLAKEKSADNTDDQLRRVLGERLALAIEQNDIAKASAALRKQELINAKAARELQELQVRLLEEREDRLKLVVRFGPRELNELFEKLDRQEDDLKNSLAKFETAAEPRIRYLEDQWIAARGELDAATGDKAALQERIKSLEIERQVLKQVPPLLRLQIDRLNGDRQVWQFRNRVFNSRPDRNKVREWTDLSNDALSQLKREERKEIFEIDELREQLNALEERLEQVDAQSAAADAINQQMATLRGLEDYHEKGLNSIRTSAWLHERLLSELEGDSLTATAKDQLHNLWSGVLAIWNYELTSFGEGQSERSVTVQKVVTALLILLAGIFLSRAFSRALGRQVLRRLDIDPSASATIQSLFYYILLLLFSLFALNIAKVPLTAFTVLGGAVALGIGFGSQNIINNFISGLILLAERPVKVGDLIQLDNLQGTPLYGNIEHIGARSTRVRTGSNLEIIVPNSSFLQNNVVNFTLSSDKVRTMVEVGVIYGSPTVTVTQLLRRAVIETGRVAKDPPPIILFKSFGDNALIFEVHFWLRMRTMMDQMQIESAVRFRIDQLFREEDITIAFPQRDVHLDTRSPLTIQMVDNSSKPTS